MIKYAKQDVSLKDIQSVVKVLKSEYLTQGPVVDSFEKKVSSYCKSKYAIAVNSATSALHLAYLSLGLSRGDYLWTSPITFVSTANAALHCGAKVDFVDIDPISYNICIKTLEDKLNTAKKLGKLPKILVAVHMAGQSPDMMEIHKLVKKFKIKIVEDASHSLGGRYQNIRIGSCKYSDICVFSFHAVKIITSGEGGMAVTNNAALAIKIRNLRSHGIEKNIKKSSLIGDEIWNYKQTNLGFNYRMTDIQAALGLSQMSRINEFIKKRNSLAKTYNKAFKNLSLITPKVTKDRLSSFHLYIIKLDINKNKLTRNKLYKYLEVNNIQPNFHYIPVYRHPYFQNLNFKKNYCKEAEIFFKTAITIPLHNKLTIKQQKFIINIVKKLVI